MVVFNIPVAPINDKAKKHNENLPGMGGVFNVVNLHVYHYAGIGQRSDSVTLKSAMLTLVYFYIIMIVHKCRQSAAQSPNYQGHTVIMTGVVDMTNKIISTVQGHIVGVPTKENYKIGTPMYGADPQYRRFRFDKLFR